MLSPGRGCDSIDHVLIQPPPSCKKESQSQCSVHKLPWCPSLPGRLRQSNTVGYSIHGYRSGVDHEIKHQKERSPFSVLAKALLLEWYNFCLWDQHTTVSLHFYARAKELLKTKSFVLCHVRSSNYTPFSGNCWHQLHPTDTKREKIDSTMKWGSKRDTKKTQWG